MKNAEAARTSGGGLNRTYCVDILQMMAGCCLKILLSI